MGPMLGTLGREPGIRIEVRYGGTSELTATILEEGENSPADLFLSQDAAALGALSGAGRLRVLPEELLDAVPSRFRSNRGDWVHIRKIRMARSLVHMVSMLSPSIMLLSLRKTMIRTISLSSSLDGITEYLASSAQVSQKS